MDKGRHPHVIRTWTVERTKTHYRPPQQPKVRLGAHQTFPGVRHPKVLVLPPHGDGNPV